MITYKRPQNNAYIHSMHYRGKAYLVNIYKNISTEANAPDAKMYRDNKNKNECQEENMRNKGSTVNFDISLRQRSKMMA